MRVVAAALTGAYALLIMSILLPWDAAECAGTTCVASDADAQFFTIGFTLLAMTIPTVVVLGILLAVLGLRATRDPEAGAVLAALGQTRGTAVRNAALAGLRDGAIAAGGAYVIAGAIHVAMLAGTGLNPVTTGANAWFGRALLGLIALITLVLAHVLTAARRPRTPVDALTSDMQEEPAPRPSLGRRAMLAGGLLALSGGVITGLAMWKGDHPAHNVSFYVTNTAGIAMIVAWAGAVAFGLWVVVPWLRARRGTVIGAAAATAGRDTRVGAVLATYAGDRSRASARIVSVLAGLGFLIAAVPSLEPTAELDEGLLTTIVVEGDIDGASLAQSFRELDGVEDVFETQAAMLDADSAYSWVFAVAPDELRSRDAALADALERHPNAVAAPLWNGEAPTEVLDAPEYSAQEIIPIGVCCGVFVNADHVELDSPGAGFFIYAQEGADREALSMAIDRVASADSGVTAMGSSTAVSAGSGGVISLLINLTLAAVVLGLPLTLLAVGAVRRRRQDDSTLTALGATAPTMRTAITVETAVVSAFAIAGGMAVGAATRIVMTALQQGRLALGPVVIDAPLLTGFNSVGWGLLGIVGAASVAIMTIAAFVTAWVTGRRTGSTGGPTGRAPASPQQEKEPAR